MISRRILISLLCAAGLFIILNQHSRISRKTAAVTARTTELAALETQTTRLKDEITALRAEVRREEIAAEIARAAEAKAMAEFSAINPDAQWAEPPETLPDWNPASPFIWIPKDLLTQIPSEPFSQNGSLNPGVAEVLGISPETRKELDRLVAAGLERFRQMEFTNVYLSTNHLPGVSHIEGKKLTIELRPPPEAGPQLKEELISAFVSKLGAQRAEILMQQGRKWFVENLSAFEPESKFISVAWRPPPNAYSLTIKGPGVWKSYGGLSDLKGLVPDHVLPYFSELTETKIAGE